MAVQITLSSDYKKVAAGTFSLITIPTPPKDAFIWKNDELMDNVLVGG